MCQKTNGAFMPYIWQERVLKFRERERERLVSYILKHKIDLEKIESKGRFSVRKGVEDQKKKF